MAWEGLGEFMTYDKAQYEFERGWSDALEGAPQLIESESYRQGWLHGQPEYVALPLLL